MNLRDELIYLIGVIDASGIMLPNELKEVNKIVNKVNKEE